MTGFWNDVQYVHFGYNITLFGWINIKLFPISLISVMVWTASVRYTLVFHFSLLFMYFYTFCLITYLLISIVAITFKPRTPMKLKFSNPYLRRWAWLFILFCYVFSFVPFCFCFCFFFLFICFFLGVIIILFFFCFCFFVFLLHLLYYQTSFPQPISVSDRTDSLYIVNRVYTY